MPPDTASAPRRPSPTDDDLVNLWLAAVEAAASKPGGTPVFVRFARAVIASTAPPPHALYTAGDELACCAHALAQQAGATLSAKDTDVLAGLVMAWDAALARTPDMPTPMPGDDFRTRVARLLAELHGGGILSEQQCAKVFGVDLVTWRVIGDREGAAHAR